MEVLSFVFYLICAFFGCVLVSVSVWEEGREVGYCVCVYFGVYEYVRGRKGVWVRACMCIRVSLCGLT